MNQGGLNEGGLNWTFAGVASLALHVIVLSLFVWSSGESAPQAARTPEEKVVETSAAEAPQQETSAERAEPKAEPEPKIEPKPKAEPKPKVEPRPKPEPKVEVKPKDEPKERERVRETPQVQVETYVVRKGDMLAHIAQDCNCTIQELAKLNGTTVKKLANLRVGQKIKVPRKGD